MVTIDDRDASQHSANVPWTLNWLVKLDDDDLLEEGEIAEPALDLSRLTTALETNTEFTLEMKVPLGNLIVIRNRTPAFKEPVMDLR